MQTHASAARGLSAGRHARVVTEPVDRSARTLRLRRGLATVDSWSREPAPWGAVLLLALVVIVVFQHPLARAIGTAPAAPATGALIQPVAQPLAPTLALEPTIARPQQSRPAVIHPPRDPFRALISAQGAILAPVTIKLRHGSHRPPGRVATSTVPASTVPQSPPTHHHAATTNSTTTAAGCPAGGYQVRAGDSLWSISQRQLVGPHGYRSVTVAWHALYAANHATIGADPGYLTAGEHLCLPPP